MKIFLNGYCLDEQGRIELLNKKEELVAMGYEVLSVDELMTSYQKTNDHISADDLYHLCERAFMECDFGCMLDLADSCVAYDIHHELVKMKLPMRNLFMLPSASQMERIERIKIRVKSFFRQALNPSRA